MTAGMSASRLATIRPPLPATASMTTLFRSPTTLPAEFKAMGLFAAQVIGYAGCLLASYGFGVPPSFSMLPVALAGSVAVQRAIARGPWKLPAEAAKQRLDGCVCVVTGCSSGIGEETVYGLLQHGCSTVFMACRNEEAAAAAMNRIKERHANDTTQWYVPGSSWPSGSTSSDHSSKTQRIFFVPFDCQCPTSIQHAADLIAKEAPQVDILINNAGGVDLSRPPIAPESITSDEMHLVTNHLGPAFFTKLCLPLVAKTEKGVVINVASIAHWDACSSDERIRTSPMYAYGLSKALNIAWTTQLNVQLMKEAAEKQKGGNDEKGNILSPPFVRAVSLHPGGVTTNIYKLSPFYDSLFRGFVGRLILKSPSEGAQTSIGCALMSREYETLRSRDFFVDCKSRNDLCSPSVACPEFQKEVREWTDRCLEVFSSSVANAAP